MNITLVIRGECRLVYQGIQLLDDSALARRVKTCICAWEPVWKREHQSPSHPTLPVSSHYLLVCVTSTVFTSFYTSKKNVSFFLHHCPWARNHKAAQTF